MRTSFCSDRNLRSRLVDVGRGIHDVLMQVDGTAAGLNGRPLYLDGAFIGVVGDTVTLTGSKHRFSGNRTEPRNFEATQEIRSPSEGSVTSLISRIWRLCRAYVLGFDELANGRCREARGESFMMRLAKLCRVRGRGMREFAVEYAMRGEGRDRGTCGHRRRDRGQRYESLMAKSLKAATAAAISVPYCAGTTPRMDFVLRKTGFANCAGSVRVMNTRRGL